MADGNGRLEPIKRVERIAGSELHYWVYHEGRRDDPRRPIIVMLHGLRGTHEGLELIAKGVTGHCAVVPDLPGCGESAPLVGARHDVQGYAAVITELISRVGQGAPVVLLGHSFGSIVAAHVASSSAESISELILVNPLSTSVRSGLLGLGSRLPELYYRLGEALPEPLGMALLSNKWIVQATSQVMVRTKDKQLRRFVHESHQQNFSRFHSPTVVGETFRATMDNTVTDYAGSLAMPVLLIAGETDDFAPLSGQRALLGALPDAELVVIPRVGHLVHYETPETAAHAITRFLGRRHG